MSGLDRIQDAVAFVAAVSMCNDLGAKEFPTSWCTEQEWLDNLSDDAEYRDFLIEKAIEVSPQQTFKEAA